MASALKKCLAAAPVWRWCKIREPPGPGCFFFLGSGDGVITSLMAISVGASAGAVLRWGLGLALNAAFPPLPMGTLVANLAGGYLIGVALALFGNHPAWAPEWRLLVITGFLGGLTTFSTFSAEVTTLLQQGRLGWAGVAISAHVMGSLLMTLLGLATVALLKQG